MKSSGIIKIISGGQTGTDRAALDYALAYGIPCGGFCPKGRLAEDGRIPEKYPLMECESTDYAVRTVLNVELSTGTLLFFSRSCPDQGTELTRREVLRLKKPLYEIEIDQQKSIPKQPFKQWLTENNISILNVAGPRESNCPGIYKRVTDWLKTNLA